MKTKKLLSVLLAAVMLLSLAPVNAVFAGDGDADVYWTDGLTAAPEGWTEDGYEIEISTPEALAFLAVSVNGMNGVKANTFKGKTIRVTEDIDLSGKYWTPIGNAFGKIFSGSFDAYNSHIINVNIKSSDAYVGFFGNLKMVKDTAGTSSISNVNLKNVAIMTSGNKTNAVGAFAGNVNGSGFISTCSVDGFVIYSSSDVKGSYLPMTGGFVGSVSPTANPGTEIYSNSDAAPLQITNCVVKTGGISGKTACAGGFAGVVGGNGKIKSCSADCKLKIDEPYISYDATAGGFVGSADPENGPIFIEGCKAEGEVKLTATLNDSQYVSAGGFIGSNVEIDDTDKTENVVYVNKCMTLADVSSTIKLDPTVEDTAVWCQFVGGFVGCGMDHLAISDCYCVNNVKSSGGSVAYTGGFAGRIRKSVTCSYCAGSVEAEKATQSYAYGFCGSLTGTARIDNCYALSESVKGKYASHFALKDTVSFFNKCYSFKKMKVESEKQPSTDASTTYLTAKQVMTADTFAGFSSDVWEKTDGKLPEFDVFSFTQSTKKADYLKITAEISAIEDQTYTGSAIEPVLEVKDGDKTLELDKDYTVSYKNNVNVTTDTSKATATVTLSGGATLDANFNILPKKITEIALDAPVKKGEPQTELDADEYTATISWTPEVEDKFAARTVYTATVTLKPKSNYTIEGVTEITVDGAESVTLKENDGVQAIVEAIFPKTKGGTSYAAGTVVGGGGVAGGSASKNDNKKDDAAEPDDKKDDEKKDDENGDNTDDNKPAADKWKNPYSDVADSDWFYEYVKYADENGLMNGTDGGNFAPNANITRGMFVTVLYRAEGEPEADNYVPFKDIASGAYYEKAVRWAQFNALVTGYSYDEFAPDDFITREQIAAILLRYAKYKGIDVSVGESTNILSYTDFDEISEYAVFAMQYAAGSGLMKGKTETTLNPKDNATRAEIAAILQRFIEGNR